MQGGHVAGSCPTLETVLGEPHVGEVGVGYVRVGFEYVSTYMLILSWRTGILRVEGF